ncbi:MAG: threonine synthase [Sulfobacillus thermotolerans]|uniref:Threonine synthase n=1 Tax=Sulfobacillus thermotolerans TaxID=338644 RepID=A0ABN5H1I2_9FIRM|nr:threonine synthase [Sulfobacillus thermotolerans]MCY0909593.1 threonine synthase [Sulfobacillus thermotolerans]
MNKGLIHRYHPWLGLPDLTPVTLGEGSTPMVHWADWGPHHIWLKLEGCNPTGSFKDRGMTVAVSQAKYEGATAVICASTGNTAASAAAYAGRGGLKAFVVVPHGQVALQKMIQASAYGAIILAVEGNFDQALSAVRHVAESEQWIALVNSVNPWRLRGQETGAYEILDDLGHAPAGFVLPVGNAGNISAYFHGFRRRGEGLPQMFGIQAQGADPLVQGHDLDNVSTVASAIRIGKPASAHLAREAVATTRGQFRSVSDDAILQAQKELAHGGVFVEPASAAAYAGLKMLYQEGRLPEGDIVAILTGNGLKDSATAGLWAAVEPQVVSSNELLTAIADLMTP